MTEFELSTLTFVANEAGNIALALYMTAISGYLLVAYSAGSELSQKQANLINGLFVFFSTAFTYSTIVSFIAMRFYSKALNDISGFESEAFSVTENAFVVIVFLALILGIFGALVFMRNIRLEKNITSYSSIVPAQKAVPSLD